MNTPTNPAIVIARIDLDRYSLETIKELVLMGIISMSEATESREFKMLSDYNKVLWIRTTQKEVRVA